MDLNKATPWTQSFRFFHIDCPSKPTPEIAARPSQYQPSTVRNDLWCTWKSEWHIFRVFLEGQTSYTQKKEMVGGSWNPTENNSESYYIEILSSRNSGKKTPSSLANEEPWIGGFDRSEKSWLPKRLILQLVQYRSYQVSFLLIFETFSFSMSGHGMTWDVEITHVGLTEIHLFWKAQSWSTPPAGCCKVNGAPFPRALA